MLNELVENQIRSITRKEINIFGLGSEDKLYYDQLKKPFIYLVNPISELN